jgi:hypothetical protein
MKLHTGKIVAVSLLVVALGCGAAYGVTWETGLKLGMNSAKLIGDPVSLFVGGEQSELAGSVSDYHLGFIGGVYVKANLSAFFGIQADFQYVQMGGEGPVAGSAIISQPNQQPQLAEFEGTLLLHLDYVEMPVLAVFSFNAGTQGSLQLRGFIGPTFAYGVSAEVQLTGEANMEQADTSHRIEAVDETRDADAIIENFQVGGVLGFSLSYALDKVDLVLDARWGRGFTTIDNTTAAEHDSYNSGISIQAGVAIPFGG